MPLLKRKKNKSSTHKALDGLHVDTITQYRMSALWIASCATFVLLLAINMLFSAFDYSPIRQQALLDSEHKRIDRQDLLKPALHNAKFRKDEVGAAADFGKFALLKLFSYSKADLESGVVRDNFYKLLSEEQAVQIYEKQFMYLSQQKIVMAQDAVVRVRIVGDLEPQGQKVVSYDGLSGLSSRPAMTYKFTGKMLLTVHGNQDYPTLFNFTILVQRARIQDRMMGYQIILLEVN